MNRDEWRRVAAELGEPRETWVHLRDVVGSCRVPAEVAAVIARAADVLVRSGDVSPNARWQALEFMAAEILSGPRGRC